VSALLASSCSVVKTKFPQKIYGLEHYFPIDGKVDFSAFRNVDAADVLMVDSLGKGKKSKKTRVRWAFLADDLNLYIAVEWHDDTLNNIYTLKDGPVDYDGVQIQFDDDGNGNIAEGEDARLLLSATEGGSLYVDQHNKASKYEADTIGNGYGKLKYYPEKKIYQAEFLLPVIPDSAGQDAKITHATRYNILIFDHVRYIRSSGFLGAIRPAERDSSSWPVLPVEPGCGYIHAGIPKNLPGLIVFVSDHEVPVGEIYTFSPSSGDVRRVTHLPGLFKDSVSLSHDRSKIVFHGTTEMKNYDSYEIYRIDIDGSHLVRLTDNNIFDAHPGWSPDDRRIVYASSREPGRISTIVMSEDGIELNNLTPAPFSDGDPDYLPDGRIIFNTNRFSRSPQLRIAVMNEDGTDVRQLTFRPGVSDHDPSGSKGKVYFERFMKDTYYATDIESAFAPWALVEIDLMSGNERIILSDRWANRIPVRAPGGQYIAYIKGVAHQEIRLIDLTARDHGRLLPEITHIRYFDWK
jgi:Tol biopolymer transport system component